MTTIKKSLQSLSLIRIVSIAFFTVIAANLSYAQDSKTEENKPVSGTYNSGIFMENQTVLMYPAKTIEFVINHRFGKVSEGIKELFGI